MIRGHNNSRTAAALFFAQSQAKVVGHSRSHGLPSRAICRYRRPPHGESEANDAHPCSRVTSKQNLQDLTERIDANPTRRTHLLPSMVGEGADRPEASSRDWSLVQGGEDSLARLG